MTDLTALRPEDAARMTRARRESRRKRFAPAPRLSPSQWIERHYRLSAETSAESGRYSFDRAPFWREVADAMGDVTLEAVVARKPSQIGYSELLKAFLARCIASDPSGILLIQPTVDLAKQFNKERIKPMIRDVPVLAEMFGTASGRREYDDTLQYLGFPGGYLALQGANSPGGLASRPVRRVLSDEVGRWPRSAGSEGDPYELADARTRTFWNRMHIAGSSPGTEGECKITELLETTDWRRYHVPCKDCGERFTLDWRDDSGDYLLRCEKDAEGNWLPDTAHFACPHCGSAHTDADKPRLLAGGVWIASRPEITTRRGYDITGLMSPWLSWPQVLRMFQAAKGSMDTLRTFINTVVGLPFAPPSERISADGLMARAEPLPEWPPWVGAFTIGVDVQKDRYELLPVGFGADQRIALMPSEQVYGDLEGPDTLRDLLEALTKPRGGLLPEAIALDTGHRNDVVWRIVDTLRARRVQAFGVKGEAHVRSIIAPPAVKGRKGVRNPWQIGTNHVKDFIEARLRADPDSSRGVLFSDQITPEMFAQLTAEERKTEWKQGQRKTVWVLRPGMRNEMLDMLGYAIGALHARGARFIVGLGQLADSRTAAPVQAPAPAPAPTIDPVLAAIQRATRRPAAQRGFLSKR